ncbi:hypothetical protein QCD79_31465, partial [Pseudomonas quasicaspiana]|nr:hypothetical protein [Pseudomonas quasicaspiana]
RTDRFAPTGITLDVGAGLARDERERGVPDGPRRLHREQARLPQGSRWMWELGLPAMSENAVCQTDRGVCIAGKRAPT